MDLIKNLIFEYENYISEGNKALMTYFNISISPLLAKRKGLIPSNGYLSDTRMFFRFHGMGCRFEFDDIVVEFDYTFKAFTYTGFEVKKLYWFVKCKLDSNEKLYHEIEFNNAIIQLEKTGFLIKRSKSSSDTYDYYVNPLATQPNK